MRAAGGSRASGDERLWAAAGGRGWRVWAAAAVGRAGSIAVAIFCTVAVCLLLLIRFVFLRACVSIIWFLKACSNVLDEFRLD